MHVNLIRHALYFQEVSNISKSVLPDKIRTSHQRFFFSERLRSGALLLTLSKKFSGGLRPPDPPMCYITFTILYNVPENFLVDIFLKFRTGKVTLLNQNELVLPRGQNDSTLLSVFWFSKKLPAFPEMLQHVTFSLNTFNKQGRQLIYTLSSPPFDLKIFHKKGGFISSKIIMIFVQKQS